MATGTALRRLGVKTPLVSKTSLLSTTPRRGSESSRRGVSGAVERDRMLVIVSTIIGTGYIVYGFVTIPVLVADADGVVASWFPLVGTVVVFGPGLAMFGVRWARDPQRGALIAAVACPIGTVLGAALWAVAGIGVSADPAVWMLDFAGLPAVALTVARPMREALAALVVCKGAAAWTALAHAEPGHAPDMLREAAFGFLFTSTFVYITSMVVRAGSSLDGYRSASADLVAASVRNAELARFDGLIHDHVISTLAAVADDPDDPRVQLLAASALARLDELAETMESESEEVVGAELVARIRTVVEPSVQTVVRLDADPDSRFPAVVGRSLAEAVGEAVRNARQHAGPAAECMVAIEVTDDRVAVVVADDGIGFDPDAVADDRLGLALSVRRRMESLDGGRSLVRSLRGAGTTVTVEWIR